MITRNRITNVLTVALAAVSIVALTAGQAAAGPLAHWTFDSTPADSGSAGQHGTLVGTAAYDTTDPIAGTGALLLDGYGLVDVSAGNAALHGLTNATISAWVRVDSFTAGLLGEIPNIFARDLTTAIRDDTDRVEINVDFRNSGKNWKAFG